MYCYLISPLFGQVYWTVVDPPAIMRANLNGTHLEVFINTSVGQLESLAVDSYSGNLYWADSKLNRLVAWCCFACLDSKLVVLLFIYLFVCLLLCYWADLLLGYWADLFVARHWAGLKINRLVVVLFVLLLILLLGARLLGRFEILS